MTELAKLNEAELDRNLNVFFHKEFSQGTYCYCGNTLVAMNLYNPALPKVKANSHDPNRDHVGDADLLWGGQDVLKKSSEMFNLAKMESVVDVPMDKARCTPHSALSFFRYRIVQRRWGIFRTPASCFVRLWVALNAVSQR